MATHQQLASYFQQAIQLHQAGQWQQAEQQYKKILQYIPSHPDTLHYLGLLKHQTGDSRQALKLMLRAKQQSPNDGELWFNLGVVHQALMEINEAMAAYKKSSTLQPQHAMSFNNLASCYQRLHDIQQAENLFRHALTLDPNCLEAKNNLANLHKDKGQLGLAEQLYLEILQRVPTNADAMNNLALVYQRRGEAGKAHALYSQALANNQNLNSARCGLLMNLHYLEAISADEIFQRHQQLSAHFEMAKQFPSRQIDARGRRLRIAYLSADFRTHSVAYFILPILEQHDRSRMEIFAYANHGKDDTVSEKIRQRVEHWRPIAQLDDDKVAQLIAEDGIDILVDLGGHTANNRIPLLARKPAPIQVNYLGYPDTTGLTRMDYRLVDEWTDPTSAPLHASETLVRLPQGFLCYQPPGDFPDVSPPPFLQNGYITFGTFNNTAKISRRQIHQWAQLLNTVPHSRLLLKSSAFHDTIMRESLTHAFAEHHVNDDRLILQGHTSSTAEHLETYGQMDIALDTFPYNGTTTTCEALWMGVPVITLAGDRHCSRVGFSLLHQVGLGELVATDENQYLTIASTLAKDSTKLTAIRQTLRQQMQNSPLMNAKGFTSALENTYEEMIKAKED
ncbi:MAG: tetratricopeptide repeat protein [Gammaproteobacteria bacterium]|nr:tetratricopeptide repeat protein [Gammaproteobacteria bacterium]